MVVLLDIAGSFIFGGLLLLMVTKLNIYTSRSHQQSTFDLHAQENCVQLGKMLENDFYSIGYGVKSGLPIQSAGADSIVFYSDIDNNGTIDAIKYFTKPMPAGYARVNPNHKLLYRKVNAGSAVPMNLGVTKLKLGYYDLAGTKTAVLSDIKAIKISLDVESNFPSVNAGGGDTVYNAVHWEQFIVPKALHF